MRSLVYKPIFVVFVCLLASAGYAYSDDECDLTLSASKDYKVQIFDTTELVEGNQIAIKRIGDEASSSTLRRDQPDFKVLTRNSNWALFTKLVTPAALGKWEFKRFKLSELIRSDGSELILGLDVNHVYLAFKEAGNDGSWTRADYLVESGGFLVRKGFDQVAEGFFLRFPDLDSGKMETVKQFVVGQKKFFSCVNASCELLAQLGFQFGSNAEVPLTTEEMLKRYLAEGIRQDKRVPDKIEVLAMGSDSLQQQFDNAIKLSQLVGQKKQKTVRGFLAVYYYGAKTVLKWLAFRS